MEFVLLMSPVLIIPLVSIVMLWVGNSDISERHHSHHDTYVVPSVFSWVLVTSVVFMGALGILLGWLCMLTVFVGDIFVVFSFFDAFLITVFVLWLAIRRYKVVTFDDRLEVTPFLGPTSTVRYADISAMEWTKSVLIPNGRNIHVFVGHRRCAMLWATIDLDQILIRINRFDAIESLRS